MNTILKFNFPFPGNRKRDGREKERERLGGREIERGDCERKLREERTYYYLRAIIKYIPSGF